MAIYCCPHTIQFKEEIDNLFALTYRYEVNILHNVMAKEK